MRPNEIPRAEQLRTTEKMVDIGRTVLDMIDKYISLWAPLVGGEVLISETKREAMLNGIEQLQSHANDPWAS